MCRGTGFSNSFDAGYVSEIIEEKSSGTWSGSGYNFKLKNKYNTLAICDKDQDCLQGSIGTSKEVCAKYKTTDQKSGVCLLPTSDPNLIVTPIPFSTTRSYNMTTRGKIIV